MKKLPITKKQFSESNYFQKKYGKLEFVSESGKLFKTSKGKILMFKEGVFGDIGDAIDSGVRGVRKFFHGKPKFKKGDIVMLCLADFSPSKVHHGEEIEDVKWNGRCWEYKMGNDPFGNAQWWPEDRVAEDPEPDKGSEPYVPEKFPEFKKFGKKFTKEASESEWLNTFKKAQDFVDKACEQLEVVAFEGGADVGNPIHRKLLRIWSEMRDVVVKATPKDSGAIKESTKKFGKKYAGSDEEETNKYGVPYHDYEITLADGSTESINVGYEEQWGDIQDCFDDGYDVVASDEENKVGYGNDADGHIEIVKVLDLENPRRRWKVGTPNTPYKWANDCVWCYVDNYSS